MKDLFDLPQTEEIEIWTSIPEWEGLYQSSTFGRVRSLDRAVHSIVKGTDCTVFKKGKILKPHKYNTGYFSVTLSKNGITTPFLIHRLIAITFHVNPLNYPQVNHKNGIKTDNRTVNLEWCTKSQNCKHAYDTGLHPNPVGEKMWTSKITDEMAKDIINRLANGEKQKHIAKLYGLDPSTISSINIGKTWKHIK